MSNSLPVTDPVVLAPSISGPTVPVSSSVSGDALLFALLQPSLNAHSAAVVGIVALAVLGGVLVARNRLSENGSIATDPDPEQREEFMTDQERVQQLLNENGGRMKQSKIVDSVDWSKAKVSRLLAELEDEDQITKLRLGRENLVCLPGHEPTASKSPEQPKSE